MLLGELLPADVSVPEAARSLDIKGVSADSRKVARGYLFVAVAGSVTDGARFAGDAIGRGAVAILTSRDAVLPDNLRVIRADDPRRVLSQVAAKLHPRQPEHIVAVTGTSGKTSVVDFARQIFAATGHAAASIGTLGVVSGRGTDYGSMTTPDPIALHRLLDELAHDGITHAAIEASSQGLDQRRVDAVRIQAAAFTNLGRDHMDYHSTVEAYFEAKLRLFNTVLPEDGVAVIDMDGARADAVEAVALARGQRIVRVGKAGDELKLLDVVAKDFSQKLTVKAFRQTREIVLPLAGAFQASNALVAAGLAFGAGVPIADALDALANLNGAPGRLELAGSKANGAMVIIDYAHKPEALVSVLKALRPMTTGLLFVVFGAGGDRDPGKRPLMGHAAAEHADVVIVTDDNPRSENPAAIRKQIIDAAPDAVEIADRGEAIRRAIAMLGEGDVLCIAGKGHETGQIIGNTTIPFSDREAVTAALAEEAA
jgi:UDP-N-acetylmuramoyl-L-alanyl-D-glutamate--2,6-diaminopimelate ligase